MTTSTEPTVVKLSTPEDMIVAIPTFLGFHPADSIVVTMLHGPKQRSGLTLRCDIPSRADPLPLARYLTEAVTRQAPTAVVVVCFSEDIDDGDFLPHHDLVDALTCRLSERDIGYLAALLVRDGAWWHYGIGEDEQSDVGTPLPDTPSVEVTALEARHVMEGRAVMASREELAATVGGPTGLRLAAMSQQFDLAFEAIVAELTVDGRIVTMNRTLRAARSAFNAYLADTTPSDDVTVRILVGLEDRNARDALMTWAIEDDTSRLVEFLTNLAQTAPDEFASPICTVLAGAAYVNHECAIATVALERALRCDPAYEMARLFDQAFRNQVRPKEVSETLEQISDDLRDLGEPVTGCEDDDAA